MSSKSLSTGTLSLRFMQNAHRAKQLKEVELDRAEVKDDGMWEVSQAVRDAWGLTRDTDSSYKNVHESSYLPFIFSAKSSVIDNSVPETSPKKIAGRRTFNSEGEEVSQLVKSSTSTADVLPVSSPTGTLTPSGPPESSSKRKVHPRPISISASGTSGQLKGFEQLQKQKDSKTARQTIFESGGVGTDLRAPSRKHVVSSTSTAFMKPAGVDDPKNASSSLPLHTAGDIIARAQVKQTKRERDPSGDEPNNSKRKLKKRSPE
ncbi:hypothetical protein BYT27DRAFT_7075843 [Phlegmacium glaucopus]|nr:hypothetical protein BYT27DRAFT_7075843 [Phlegmacium glaucopus]